jgi:uncharacterized membrane protein
MDKQIVVVVPSEVAAFEALEALRFLDVKRSIELHSTAVVGKEVDGTFVVREAVHPRGAIGALLGASTGALVGLLAGPTGAAAGAVLGGAGGAATDLAYTGFVGEFVRNVAASMQPGTYAVCASVWEDWTVPIDTAVAPFGAVVFRQAMDDVVTAQMKADWQAATNDLAQAEAALSHAVDEERTKLVVKRDELRELQAARRERLQQRVRDLQEGWDAEVASIEDKARVAHAEAKRRHEEHVMKLTRFVAAQKQALHDLFA